MPAAYLEAELDKLELAHEFELVVETGKKMGITGTQATVRLREGIERPLRHLSTIKGILGRAGFAPKVCERAVAMFETIAEAEAKIHGTTVEAIHFHEVGATDSIVDIAGGRHRSRLPRCGSRLLRPHRTRQRHGPLCARRDAGTGAGNGRDPQRRALPLRWRGRGGDGRPRGQPFSTARVDRFDAPAGFKASTIGYGVGMKDFRVPNVLRLSLGEVTVPIEAETNLEVQCNIDDMTPEAFQPLMDALFAKGARDVFLTPIVMKKARPGTRLSVLVDEARLDAVLDELFAGSTTIGVRLHEVAKRMLPRQERTVDTTWGPVRVKVVTLAEWR